MEMPAVNPEARAYNPKFRKRKKWQGATWTPKNESAEAGDGYWCRDCKKRHGAMSCGVTYDKNSKGEFLILWFCKKTGTVLEETVLGQKGGSDGSLPVSE